MEEKEKGKGWPWCLRVMRAGDASSIFFCNYFTVPIKILYFLPYDQSTVLVGWKLEITPRRKCKPRVSTWKQGDVCRNPGSKNSFILLLHLLPHLMPSPTLGHFEKLQFYCIQCPLASPLLYLLSVSFSHTQHKHTLHHHLPPLHSWLLYLATPSIP